jgi:anti-sigma regulatory factor (Ser/Thr protein kinase)
LEARLQLASDLSEVARLNSWLDGVFASCGASVPAAEAARLCLNELVANAMLYGYPDGRPGRIDVTVRPAGGALHVAMEDDGIAFDPLTAPVTAPMTGLEDARIGGYGIKLFCESSRSARYERSGGRNRLAFTCG